MASRPKWMLILTLATCAGLLAPPAVQADGTETLGPPSVAVAEGNGVVCAGVGMVVTQPGTLNVEVPPGATVKQVLLYVAGYHNTDQVGDTMTFKVNGNDVVAARIGGPVLFAPPNYYPASYRVDITSLNLVAAGANDLTVGNVGFQIQTFGAGAMVSYDLPDAAPLQTIVRDGMDAAYHKFVEPLKTTVEQVYEFESADEERIATLWLMVGSAKDNNLRPNLTTVKIGDEPAVGYGNLFTSSDGREWDTVKLELAIPAGVTTVAVRLLSEDPDNTKKDPASLIWVNGTLLIARPAEVELLQIEPGCTATIGFWQNKNGQALIKALPGETDLGDWLANNWPNLYANLAGKTNAQVADAYKKLFAAKVQGPKLECQIMAVALACYVTNQTLAGDVAERYGFEVDLYGTCSRTWNVGKYGPAFGVPNDTVLQVCELLDKIDEAFAGGAFYGGDKKKISMANEVFTAINEAGDI